MECRVLLEPAIMYSCFFDGEIYLTNSRRGIDVEYLGNIIRRGFADHDVCHACNLIEKESLNKCRALARRHDKSSVIKLSQNPITFGKVFGYEISPCVSHDEFRTL